MNLAHPGRSIALVLAAGLLAAFLVPLAAVTAPSAGAATTASISSGVKITKVVYNPKGNDNHYPNREKVYIKNVSGSAKNLQDVVLSDDDGHRFFLPSYRLGAGKVVAVHSGSGTNGSGHLYARWNKAVWNNTGDVARLKANPSWKLISKCTWNGGYTTRTC